jgi:hypothetical protein
MPLVDVMGHVVLRCVNDHLVNAGVPGSQEIGLLDAPALRDPDNPGRSKEPPKTTMESLADWGFITTIRSPNPPGAMPIVTMRDGTPIRLYMCRVCGYVEMYVAAIVAPEVWGKNG